MPINELNLETLLAAAVEIDDACQREAYVRRVCAADPAQLVELQRMVHDYFAAGSLIDRPAAVMATVELSAHSDISISQRIGPYKLLEQIGEGGMGAVYVAEQKEPVRRTVALKVIKPGMETRQVVARFEAERQALAMMNHPNIAKVLDAGATEAGRPYFVMELVKGVPITEFCDQQKLDVRQRLQLFTTVCQAVQHAHQKGLIHRDIKPSNVLVEMHDVTPVPKVIDFGVAKAIGQQLTEMTLHTGFSQMVGTPLYMSPEQAGQSSIDVDTRSDVYSLGVLLYEILTGHTPFENETLRNAGYDEMRRIIREVDPPRPSARISTLQANALSTISDRRKVEPRKLSQQLRGELDWIVMKTLEKDRNRRYESASSLARDLQHYLADEPVEARPATVGYRFCKYSRRHKVALVALSLVAMSLLLGTITTVREAIRASTAERLAKDRLENEQKSRRESEIQREKARAAEKLAGERYQIANDAVNAYLNRVTEDEQLKNANFQDLRKKLLEAGVPFYQKLIDQKPQNSTQQTTQGEALQKLGILRSQIGEHESARKDLERSISVLEKLAAQSPSIPKSRHQLAVSHRELASLLRKVGASAEAQEHHNKALEISEQLVRQFPDVKEYLFELSNCNLVIAIRGTGSFDKNDQHLKTAKAIADRLLRESPNEPKYLALVAGIHHTQATLFATQPRWPEARQQLEQALAIWQRLTKDVPDKPAYRINMAGSLSNLALFTLAGDTGSRTQAERESGAWKAKMETCRQYLERGLAIQDDLVRDFPNVIEFRDVLASMHGSMAQCLKDVGRHGEALQHRDKEMQIRNRQASEFPAIPKYRADLASRHYDLGMTLLENGKNEDAQKQFETSFDIQRQLVHDFPLTPEFLQALSLNHRQLAIRLELHRKPTEARQQFEKAISIQEQLAKDYPDVPEYQLDLALTLRLYGQILFRQDNNPEPPLVFYARGQQLTEAVLKQNAKNKTARSVLRDIYASRASLYEKVKRYVDAVTEWRLANESALDLANKFGMESEREAYRGSWAKALCLAGDVEVATAEAASLADDANVTVFKLVECARIFSLASVATSTDAEHREQYAARGVTILHKAKEKGYFANQARIERMQEDPNLSALQHRADFQKLVEELKQSSPAKPTPSPKSQ